jgi:hypothetical protein
MMIRQILIALIVLSMLTLAAEHPVEVWATSWGSSVALPNSDPNINNFPTLLQTSNFSAGRGAIWLAWEKACVACLGSIDLMVHDQYGWGGVTALVSDGLDNIAPAMAELANGTIVLAWSRGTGTSTGYDLYWKGFNGIRWTSPSPLVQATGNDLYPDLLRLNNGTLWLFWYRVTATNAGGDLFFKSYNGTAWTSEKTLVATSFEEKFPAATQSADGRVWLLYESNVNGVQQLWDKVWNGTAWSSAAVFTNTVNMDIYPSIVQDRSGVLWVYWSRELPTKDLTNPFQWDLFYKNSTDNGNTWKAEAQIANPQFTNSDEFHPTIIQSFDKTLWVVYDSNQPVNNPWGTFNLYILQSTPVAGHDLAVTFLKTLGGYGSFSSNPRTGEVATVYITVTNLGDFADTSTLNAYVNSTQIGSTSITLSAGRSMTYSFFWNSTGSSIGRYQALAKVAPMSGEVVMQNNNLAVPFLLVSRGDVNRDGRVNIFDLALVAVHFGTQIGQANYWFEADLTHDGYIDIRDLTICGILLGQGV